MDYLRIVYGEIVYTVETRTSSDRPIFWTAKFILQNEYCAGNTESKYRHLVNYCRRCSAVEPIVQPRCERCHDHYYDATIVHSERHKNKNYTEKELIVLCLMKIY